MKNQKKMTTIAASIAMVAVSAVTLGIGTFAWFTRGTEATATGFDFTASAATGMQISTDGFDWKTSITAADFNTAAGAQLGNRVSVENMEPVSAADSVVGGALSFYGATSGDGNFTVTGDSSNFLMFDLYFLNEGVDNLTLMLGRSSSVVDGVNDKNTSLSTRVAFINEGTAVPASAADLYAAENGNSAYIWEPNSLYRSQTAINKGAVQTAKYSYYGMSNTGVINNIDHYGLIGSGAYNSEVATTKDLAVGDSNHITTLTAGQVTKVTVYVWIEGQDVDCDNGTSAGDVTINLSFDSASTTGDSANVVDTLTPSAIAADVVSVNGTSYAGAEYVAYVLSTAADAQNADLDVTRLLATGSQVAEDDSLASITVSDSVSGDLVVVGYYTGAVSARAAN